MEPSTWIAIYLPIFIMFFVIIPSQQRVVKANILKRKRGAVQLSNELIINSIGKVCKISTGSMGATYNKVKVIEVVDNWIKVEGKGKTYIINSDFVQSITIQS